MGAALVLSGGAPLVFSQADDLIRRAHQHTADWVASPMSGPNRQSLPLFAEHPPPRLPESAWPERQTPPGFRTATVPAVLVRQSLNRSTP